MERNSRIVSTASIVETTPKPFPQENARSADCSVLKFDFFYSFIYLFSICFETGSLYDVALVSLNSLCRPINHGDLFISASPVLELNACTPTPIP